MGGGFNSHAMPKTPKTPADPEVKVPPPPVVMAVLILLLCVVAATVKYTFYPDPPAAWSQLHAQPGLPLAEVNRILAESGAVIGAIKAVEGGSAESWLAQHRTGSWQIIVHFKQTPAGLVYASEEIRCDITHFPGFTRTWGYPEGAAGVVAGPAAVVRGK